MKKLTLCILMLLVSFNALSLDRYTITNLVKQLQPAVVTITQNIQSSNSIASGVIVSSDGFVVTNYHAVAGGNKAYVKLADGKTYDATVVSYDEKTDLAVLKMGTYDAFRYVMFANSDKVEVGELVFAIGSPYGFEKSVSMGIISGKNRQTGKIGYEDFLQTDAAINPGNSGGPLFNLDGQLIGINTASLKTGNGIGLAIPSNLVQRVITQLKQKGAVQRPTIGVEVADITRKVQTILNLNTTSGAVVYKIKRGSSAQMVGLMAGDVIISFNESNVNNALEFRKILEHSNVGSMVRMRIIRNNKLINYKIRLQQEK